MSVAICQKFREGAIIGHPDKHPIAPTWIIDELQRVFILHWYDPGVGRQCCANYVFGCLRGKAVTLSVVCHLPRAR